jgi:hypothetical protein
MNWSKKALDGILVLGGLLVAFDYLVSWQQDNVLDLVKQDILIIVIVVGPIVLLWLYLGRLEEL